MKRCDRRCRLLILLGFALLVDLATIALLLKKEGVL